MGGKFYVYEHWRPDTGGCFYVGLGRGRRCSAMYGRTAHHMRTQRKLARQGQSIEVRIIASALTKEEAIAREVERIAYWRALGIKLVNRTAGGDGCRDPCAETRELMRQRKLGVKLSDEHKAKIAEKSRKYASDPAYRKRLSDAVRAAVSTPAARKRASEHFKKLIRTPEHCARIAASKTGLKQSPEHRAKTIRASLGRKQTPEEIEKRRRANAGKKRSAEFCQKMRELNLGRKYWLAPKTLSTHNVLMDWGRY